MRNLIHCLVVLELLFTSMLLAHDPQQDKTTPVLRMEEVSRDGANEVSCKWVIENPTPSSIYVYSTFLGEKGKYMLEFDSDGTMLLLATEQRQVSALPAYYYPPAEFLEVPPGGTVRGSLRRTATVPADLKKVSKVRLVFGYGVNPDDLKLAIHESERTGREFQANAIVRWQKLLFSNVAALNR